MIRLFFRVKKLAAWVVAASMIAAGCRQQSSPIAPAAVVPHHSPDNAATANACLFTDRAASLGMEFTYVNGSEANHCTILESMGGGVAWSDFDRDGWLDLIVTGGGKLTADKSISGCASALYRNLGGHGFSAVSRSAGIESTALYSHGVAIGDFDNDGFLDFLVTGYGQPQLWQNMGDGTFREIARSAGIANSLWSTSAGWADLNGDGNLDLYLAHYVNWSFQNHPFCQGTDAGDRDICPPQTFEPLPHSVYYSQGDGAFRDSSSFAGLRADGKGLGVLLCDIEPDGDVDIYVANDTTENFLYLNDGEGRFEESGVSRGVAVDDNGLPNGSMGVDLCDFNRDGKPDIWVTNYERESFAMYRNEGNGQFLHVSQRLGITNLAGLFVGFGTACEDFDSDGDQDLMIANGHVIKFPSISPRRQLPLLLQYDGQRFERAPSASGSYFDEPHEGRGLATADYDSDGDLDVAISHLNEPLALLVNEFHVHNRWLSVVLIGTRSNRDAVGARAELKTSAGTLVRQVTGGGSYLSHSSRALNFALPDQVQPHSLVIHWPAGAVQKIDASSLSGQVTLIEPVATGSSSGFSRQVPR
ncbi:MAG: CRTAC1 family protein [Planctomycetaceae bacterium]|nr:CRTAC1 family protein [Planctomycetaceae bacterium]